MGLPLGAFLKRVGVRPTTVARKTNLHASTITRLRDGTTTPRGVTRVKLDRWAAEVADALELRPAERLSWDHLLEGERRAGGGGA